MGVRIHTPADGETSQEGASLCGRHAVFLSYDGERVTCTTCLRLRARRPRAVSWDEALRDVLALLSGPPVRPYPVLTPDEWRRMRCRSWVSDRNADTIMPRHFCRCDFCTTDEANARPLADWEASQAMRPHRRYACEFGSIRAAFEALLRHRQDGAPARSSQGSLQARSQEAAQLGTHVQTTARHDRDSLDLRRVTWAVDVERALERAFAEEQERRGLPIGECVSIVLSSVDSRVRVTVEQWAERTGLSVRAVRSLVSHGRREAERTLAAAGYVPEPRRRVRR